VNEHPHALGTLATGTIAGGSEHHAGHVAHKPFLGRGVEASGDRARPQDGATPAPSQPSWWVQVPARPEGRRLEVALAARRTILRQGLEATTLRDIGREAGFTTGVITHHFPDKEAVIAACFELVSADWLGEVEARLAGAVTAEEQLSALVGLAIPADPQRQQEWRLWAETWIYAGRTPTFAGVLLSMDTMWERRIADVLGVARAAGLLRADLDVALEATILARLVDGLGIRAWVCGDWPGARRALAGHLRSLGLPPGLEALFSRMVVDAPGSAA
jgi:AcrR family transcriptional regulator